MPQLVDSRQPQLSPHPQAGFAGASVGVTEFWCCCESKQNYSCCCAIIAPKQTEHPMMPCVRARLPVASAAHPVLYQLALPAACTGDLTSPKTREDHPVSFKQSSRNHTVGHQEQEPNANKHGDRLTSRSLPSLRFMRQQLATVSLRNAYECDSGKIALRQLSKLPIERGSLHPMR